ncbi:P-loop containing nucleoside triphosphate hydrolase protein [Hypoxylon rubiginosum]|uniref:P-loop containing nucleoside triphosphate hydrolase protein n=1 Tax=Hypoxylon rubiginosum TaxID=110542 RepID=A0ACC0CLJ8_9PEZI|nr:P-loop containing nucleoside triphosphate hydrolase protein [Hypoxylon rubiginosum]
MAVMPLQSKDHKTLMDIIDNLRSKGINRYVHLPQIVVCGDQSSGKSSVLQAISGMSFPTKDSLCTRFATELILRRTDEQSGERCNVSISPGADRSAEEKARLEKFHYSEIPQQHDIGALVDEAKEDMGVGGERGRTFCKDILRIEISGPTQPHLTIVDLPGLFRAGNKEQSAEDATIVQELVRSYMQNPRTIILAVVSAQSNFALQEVTQLAREIDVRGDRTLGLITKPDTLDLGSASERDYFDLAQNKDVKFRLGWHVMRNRDFKSRNASNEERDIAEAEFFSRGIWVGLPRSQKGAANLRTRLSEVLKDQIIAQLPEVLDEIQTGLDDCTSRLEKLGTPRRTMAEQRKYLLNASHQFSMLLTEAKDGFYRHKFFGSARDDEGLRKRLRAVVQNTLTDFSQEMRIRGQARHIVETLSPIPMPWTGRKQILRSEYLKEVKDLMRRTRGCELPGTYNPLIIGELFHEQCAPWRRWLEVFSDKIFKAVEFTVNSALSHILDKDTKVKLWGELINDELDQLNRQLRNKVDEILRPHEDGHPITYNHYLTETVQKIRSSRFRENVMRGLREANGNNFDSASIDECFESVVRTTEADMETLSCSDAVDWMEAYYKVALKEVVDDFSKLAIEACLISKLPELFTPEIVYDLSEDTVSRITAESLEKAEERRFLTEKKEILSSGMVELLRLSKHHQRTDCKFARGDNYLTPDES